MSKKITSFAAFLEQTERKEDIPSLTRAESAPDAENTSGAILESDADLASGTETASHAKTGVEPVRKVRDADSARGAESAPVRGHLRVPNEVIHQILPTLKPSEAIVLLRLYALSHGFQKNVCTVSLDKLASGCNLSRTQTRVCVRSLERKNHIKSLGVDNTNSSVDLRGLHFEVKLPSTTRAEFAPGANSASRPKTAPNKERPIKENTQTQSGGLKGSIDEAGIVGVGSKFNLEECRSYAEYLRTTGQGIINPGGYATTIHRTGEADALIEKFLKPETPPAQPDATSCPDCNGSGFYYPTGYEGGVAKCKHEKLAREITTNTVKPTDLVSDDK